MYVIKLFYYFFPSNHLQNIWWTAMDLSLRNTLEHYLQITLFSKVLIKSEHFLE
jgi:hypothetical protein